MQQRKYTHFRKIQPQIIAMREEGMSRTQIAEELGLTWKQVDNWVTRYNKRKTALVTGLPSTRKGRPRVRPLTTTEEYEKEIARMINLSISFFLISSTKVIINYISNGFHIFLLHIKV